MILKTDTGAYIAPDENFLTIQSCADSEIGAREKMYQMIDHYKVYGFPNHEHIEDFECIDEVVVALGVPPAYIMRKRFVRKGSYTFIQQRML